MPVQEKEWEDRVKRLLKAEIARKGITYAQLVGKLADIGVHETEPNICNKISRGKSTAVFPLHCLSAVGVTRLEARDQRAKGSYSRTISAGSPSNSCASTTPNSCSSIRNTTTTVMRVRARLQAFLWARLSGIGMLLSGSGDRPRSTGARRVRRMAAITAQHSAAAACAA